MPRIHYQRISCIVIVLLCLALVLHVNHNRLLQSHPDARMHEHGMSLIDFLEDNNGKVDWVDHASLRREEARSGPGEHGTGVSLSKDERADNAKLLNVNGFSALASDKISLRRSIRDLRLEQCKGMNYSRDLPQASIIIPFHDEHWSTLLRTVHSLIHRAPDRLVHEVILVDDNSTKSFLGSPLEEYVAKTFGNVYIIRTKQREGLIRARLIGAKAALAPVLIFIDSHCEAGINWLPPLLQPIRDNYRTITCPFIDVINNDDFTITAQDEGARGAFDWNFDYKRLPRLPGDREHPARPFDSPVMAGGLFAISRLWFWELGGYDSGLEVWGGEQYELSFKLWMCGGKMVDIPCSRIAHVYRRFNPFVVPSKGDFIRRNYKRIAEVWMDNWKRYIYEKHPGEFARADTGDLAEQKLLRARLQCRSFDWFMSEIAFDLTKHYPVFEPLPLAKGKIMSEADSSVCIDSKFGEQGDRVTLDRCFSDANSQTNGEQQFEFTWRLEIRPKGRSVCLDYPSSGRVVMLYQCHMEGGNQLWKYNVATKQLFHAASSMCLESNVERQEVFMTACLDDRRTQRWILEGLNEALARKSWT